MKKKNRLIVGKTEKIKVKTDVKVYVNDVCIDTEENGSNPQAFIYNGTTYIAARAVSNALRQEVTWDGKTRSVYVGRHGDDGSNLFTVCPPYQSGGLYPEREGWSMAGDKYPKVTRLCGGGFALFNLNGEYETLTFTTGHLDGEDMKPACFKFYLDGELTKTIELTADHMPAKYEIPLNRALQLKLVGEEHPECYGFVDLKVL